MNKITLFCLPYAGGSAMVYSKWKPYLHQSINLVPVELAGRGMRLGDEVYATLTEAVNDVYCQISAQLANGPFAFFGHSMGSLIVFELIYEIMHRGGFQPEHVFFSGRRAPHFQDKEKLTYLLPEEEFKQELLRLGGTPPIFFENKELCDLFIPLIRTDYKLLDTYEFRDKERKIDCGISVLSGKEDTISYSELIGWENYCTGKCEIIHFDGGHFFINDEVERITDLINRTFVR